MDVKKAAAETKDYIVSIRREFHRYPELSLQEFRTAQRIEEELDKFGIPHTRVGETGVLGTLKGAKDNGKVLVLRADIDALPIEETHECVYRSENAGVMHACGHEVHAACLLGAAQNPVGEQRRVQRKGPSCVSTGRRNRKRCKAVCRSRCAGWCRARVRSGIPRMIWRQAR